MKGGINKKVTDDKPRFKWVRRGGLKSFPA